MADEFWKAVFEKLIDNLELLKLICLDTSNADLLAWAKPNSRLWIKVSRFIRKGLIADKEGFVKEMLSYAATDNPLRRIILLTWVEKNQNSMDFFKKQGNQESIDNLAKGQYGNIDKIRILSMIDPREGKEKLYKDILEKAEVDAKASSSEETTFALSSAELEAASHSKEIIASADTSIKQDPLNFNSAVLEELEKIKAAVEVLQDVNNQIKAENKSLRDERGKRQTEVATYSTKLETSVKQAKELESQLLKEKELNASLESQLKAAKAEIKSLPLDKVSESELNDLRFRLDEALKENKNLEQRLTNREASLDRIKAENEELKKTVANLSDQSQLVSSLQKRLADSLKKENDKAINLVGQVLTKTKFPIDFGDKAGKKCWLFVSITGQIHYLALDAVPANQVVPEELVLAKLDENEQLLSFESLDTDKREVYGFVKSLEGNQGVLVTEEEELPINLEITEKWADRPARGVFLPELEGRSAGVYKLDILPANANLKKTTNLKSTAKVSNKAEQTEAVPKFNGQKVIVFGGDRVGLEYERSLNKAGLNSKWFSGFALLSEISLGGFGKPDLIVVVTKQLSHALLREITAYAEKNSLPIAYSTQRGITSVFKIVTQNL